MNKELFMKIVFSVLEYDDYFMCKKNYTGLWGSHRFRNARLTYGALPMEHHVIRMRTIYALLSRHALKPWEGFVGQLWQCLKKTICELKLNKTQLELWHKM
jgi:hypothetical protein